MLGSKNKPGNAIDSHPGWLIQPSAKDHNMEKNAVVATKPAVIGSAWSLSAFIIFSLM